MRQGELTRVSAAYASARAPPSRIGLGFVRIVRNREFKSDREPEVNFFLNNATLQLEVQVAAAADNVFFSMLTYEG